MKKIKTVWVHNGAQGIAEVLDWAFQNPNWKVKKLDIENSVVGFEQIIKIELYKPQKKSKR